MWTRCEGERWRSTWWHCPLLLWRTDRSNICRHSVGASDCTMFMFSGWLVLLTKPSLFAGPSYTVDSACSSSLYALEHAYKSIRDGHCDAAIVGGCNLCLHPYVSLQFARLGVLSQDGRCKSFDEGGKVLYTSALLSRRFEGWFILITVFELKSWLDFPKLNFEPFYYLTKNNPRLECTTISGIHLCTPNKLDLSCTVHYYEQGSVCFQRLQHPWHIKWFCIHIYISMIF